MDGLLVDEMDTELLKLGSPQNALSSAGTSFSGHHFTHQGLLALG